MKNRLHSYSNTWTCVDVWTLGRTDRGQVAVNRKQVKKLQSWNADSKWTTAAAETRRPITGQSLSMVLSPLVVDADKVPSGSGRGRLRHCFHTSQIDCGGFKVKWISNIFQTSRLDHTAALGPGLQMLRGSGAGWCVFCCVVLSIRLQPLSPVCSVRWETFTFSDVLDSLRLVCANKLCLAALDAVYETEQRGSLGGGG